MKLGKLMDETRDFFSNKKKDQLKKADTLEKILGRLIVSRDKLKKEYKKSSTKKKKKEIAKEYKAVVKLLSKARKRYKKIQASL